MIKKNIIAFVDFSIELLILYFCFELSGISHLDFYRYAVSYVCLYLVLRTTKHNLLIWQDMKNAAVFYIVLFAISMVMQPLKELDLYIVGANIFIFLFTFIFSIVVRRTFRVMFFERLSDNVMIIGVGDLAQNLRNTYRYNRFSMADLKCYVRCVDGFSFNQEEKVNDLPVYDFKDIDKCLKEYQIDTVAVAITQAKKQDITIINDALRGKVISIKYFPQINNLVTYESKIEDYDGIIAISNNEVNNNKLELFFKRIEDIIAGLAGVILLIPISIILKIIFIKNKDFEPMIFTQNRIGKHGKIFKIYKFRSMVPNAEAVLEELMAKDPKIREEYLTNKKLDDDPRVTKVGKLIRKTSIDELPQLINVLIGQMSLVGPRPYLPREIEDMGVYYAPIIKSKPGITGMWQVSGRSDVSFNQRLRLDEYYCKNWNTWLDFTILVKTFKALITKDGAK